MSAARDIALARRTRHVFGGVALRDSISCRSAFVGFPRSCFLSKASVGGRGQFKTSSPPPSIAAQRFRLGSESEVLAYIRIGKGFA